jgi:CBS domain-containing protein
VNQHERPFVKGTPIASITRSQMPTVAQSGYTLTLPIKHLIKRGPLFIEPNATTRQAAKAMQDERVGSILVRTDPPGIITDRDLRGKILAQGLTAATPAQRVMTRPLKTIDSDASSFSALRLMLDENLHHLPVVEEGEIIGVVSAGDLLIQEGNNPLYLRAVLEDFEEPAKLERYGQEVAKLVQSLFRGGLSALHISQLVSSLNDALVRRVAHVTVQVLGPPPTPFAWIVFGSEGRLEQTLLTDQDNAIIYDEDSPSAQSYFPALAKRVVNNLLQVGFPSCPGGFMATNWCKPLKEWQQLFTRWVRLPEPNALLDAAIFFDFRAVAGDLSLNPLDELIVSARGEKRFLAHLARSALEFRPLLGFFNRLRSEGGKVDLKKSGIAAVVGLARVAALAAGSRERSTLERLAVAQASQAILTREDSTTLAEIFPFLFQLRLAHQLRSMQASLPVDHTVRLSEMSTLERRHLKEAFVAIKHIQEGVRAAWQLDRFT